MMCHQHRFILRPSVEQFAASPELREKYLFFLNVAENIELDGYTVDDFYDWVAEPMLPIFRELPPRDNIGSTLDEFLFPETEVYEVLADGDKMVAIQQEESEDISQVFGVSFPEDTDFTPWPTFKPSEIKTSNEQIGPVPSHVPRKVFLKDGTAAYLKLTDPGDKSILLHEISTYRKIHNARLDKTLRISHLIGLVQSIDDKEVMIYGLLLTYIDCENMTLRCAVQKETPEHLRTRWASQVSDTLAQLHDARIVWGDAKPNNVLVNYHDDAWIIDFGGGYTEGWVERGLAGTKEGDLQALGRITEFIHTAEEPTSI
ncbi:Protein kinase domain-containing protein [Trichoderma simmonsii]|uniref:Protein kinase domain-containing protein n=1 Tax=Trichoderma simmonsii TaxID=1491479 RepID=A0A8G0LIM1_9HYPO|nr:Protein kinase domain-containing protein [Trichoderma simmonsii]